MTSLVSAVPELGAWPHRAQTMLGKRVLVTGASRGIGRAIAARCVQLGAHVGLNSRREQSAFVREFVEAGAMELVFDVRDPPAIGREVKRFLECTGGVDILVNNAGLLRPDRLHRARIEDIRAQLDTLLLGPIVVTQAVLPVMLAQESGLILNIGSAAAVRPSPGQTAYAAAKGGLDAFTRAIAVEYARAGIRAICLRLGPTASDGWNALDQRVRENVIARVPLGRIASTAEVAEFSTLLMSEAAAFATGAIVDLDGGYA